MKFIMNFLRSPFQFRSTDQANNKSDSASPTVENMFIDPTTGISTDPRWRAASPGIGTSSSSGSPRLQHRVPGFENNGNCPIEVIREPSKPQSSFNEDGEKAQRVRVVPVKVESVDDSSTPSRRPGTFHSNSGTMPRSGQFGPLHPSFEDLHNRKRHSSGPAFHKNDPTESKPKVCNIPIFIEGRDTPVVPKTSPSSQNVPVHNVTKPDTQTTPVKQNGGNLTKCATKTKSKQDAKQSNHDVSLKQISDIMSEFQALKTGVEEFKGVPQDKQYRYFDEMLTRCMLKLDNVETYGDDDVRGSRKAAIKAVEKCINDLECRAQANAKLDQPAVASVQAEEKCSSDIKKEEEMSISQEQGNVSESEDIRKTVPVNLPVPNEQTTAEENSVAKDSALCPEGTESTKSKPEMVVEQTECMDVSYANKNSDDVVSKPMDVDEMSPEQSEEPGERTQVKDNQSIVSMTDSKTPEGAQNEPMEGAEVTDVASGCVGLSKQTELMDSDEVPQAQVKLDSETEFKSESADSEMVEVSKEPLKAESENSSVPAAVSN